MSSSDSYDAPRDQAVGQPASSPEPSPELDPVIAEAVDGITNRFGVEGLAQMIAYAESSLAEARKALQELADADE